MKRNMLRNWANLKLEVRNRKPEVGNQKAITKNWAIFSDFILLTSYFFLTHHKRVSVIILQCNTGSPYYTFQRVVGNMYRQLDLIT